MDSSSTGRSGGASYAGQQETSAAFDPLHQHQQQYPADHNAENNYPSNHFDRSSSGHMRISVDDSAIDAYRDSPDAYPSLKRVSSMNNMSSSRKSYDDQLFSDPRMQRLQQAEATIRRDMFKECTFRPQIKGLPVAYGPLKETGTPFVMRMEKWKKEREQDLKTKKSISIRSVEDQCSFKPKINKYSDKAVMEIRGPSSPETAHERLFKSSLALIEQRARLLEEESLREQQSIEAQCTFRPSLITKNHPSFQQVTAKFNRVTANHRDESSQRIEAHLNKDCTFTPTVNRVRPSMSSAKLYLSTNVVDRLSRPVTAEPKAADESMLRTFDSSFAESNVIDAATFIGSLHAAAAAGPGTGAGAQSRPTTPGGPAAAASQTPAKTLTKEEVRARQEKFHNFCSRQQSMLDKKKKSLQELERHITPAFTPKVSQKVAASGQKLTREQFLQRVQHDVQRRTIKEQRQEIEAVQAHSFKPEINKRAEAMRSRTAFEMSRGDSLRKEANNRMLKLKADQEQLANVTLQPAISARAKESGKSCLSVINAEDSTQYVNWLREKERKLEEKRGMEKKRREEMELVGCTFAPKTTECPAYIKRIKNSMDLVKAARSADSVLNTTEVKPEWR